MHLEGTVRHATAVDLARLHGVPPPPPYDYSSLAGFLEIYSQVAGCMRTADDFARVVREHAQATAAEGVSYAEVSFNPFLHPDPGGWIDGLVAGRREAMRDLGLEISWLVELSRGASPADGERAIELALATEGVVGIGLVGDESVSSASLAPAVRRARRAGLGFMPHAGQTGGPSAVREALDVLEADRLAHGVSAASDPALMRELVEREVCLCVCPSSNAKAGFRPDFGALVDAGVTLTVNTDDPAFVGTTLRRELELAQSSLGLDGSTLVAAAWKHRFPGPNTLRG